MSLIKVRRLYGGLFELAMDDPETENRLTELFCRELMESLQDLGRESSLKALLVRGRPRVFCSGASRDQLEAAARVSGSGASQDQLEGAAAEESIPYRDFASALLEFPMPVVGAIEGHAVGGGLMLALLLCDITVAAAESRYGLNFASLGFTPGMGATSILPEIAGYPLAIEMLLTGRFYRGSELANRGVFNHVTPAAEVWNTALDLAKSIEEKPTYVLAMLKETLNLERRRSLEAAIDREIRMQEVCFSKADSGERISAAYINHRARPNQGQDE